MVAVVVGVAVAVVVVVGVGVAVGVVVAVVVAVAVAVVVGVVVAVWRRSHIATPTNGGPIHDLASRNLPEGQQAATKPEGAGG